MHLSLENHSHFLPLSCLSPGALPQNDDKHIIKKKLEEALDDYLKINVKNNEEIELYKLLFSLNVEFRMLGIGIDSLENMIKTK